MINISTEEIKNRMFFINDEKSGNPIPVVKVRDLLEFEKPKGEWKLIDDGEWACSECGHIITTQGSWENPLSTGAYHCENCGADMRGGDE